MDTEARKGEMLEKQEVSYERILSNLFSIEQRLDGLVLMSESFQIAITVIVSRIAKIEGAHERSVASLRFLLDAIQEGCG